MNKTVLEYLEGYFDGQLNESISDDNIMEAFAELLETANAVEEYMDEAFVRKATDDMHHEADRQGNVNTARSGIDKSIDANNFLMGRRRKSNKYSDEHTKAEDEARAARTAKISARTIRNKSKSEPVMLRIPPGASTTPKPKTPSLARQIRKLIKR
jgi:hypothetical protein